MHILRTIILSLGLAAALCAPAASASERTALGKPDLKAIQAATTDEHSQFYYPTLLKAFLRSDTTMTSTEYQYFYYGTLFQEDFDPYRPPVDSAKLSEIQALYYKTEHTNAEEKAMLRYAEESIQDNPLDLVQLKNKIYVLQKQRKDNLAKIWKNKLNHLLYVIASSGTGRSKESPWVVVYPRHEFDVFNISGMKVLTQEYEFPHFDHITAGAENHAPEDYYFDLGPLLEQYYMKHPSETEGAVVEDESGE